jgi:hypothetical protein
MDNYFNGNEEYNPNKRFGDSNVYIDFNFADLDKDVVNNTKEIEQMRNAPGGQLESYKGLATSALYANLNNAYLNNPGAKRELLAQYQSKHTPEEFTQMSMEEALQKANTALKSASTFRALASKEIDPTRKNELLAQASDADNNAKFWSNFNAMDNPDLAYQYGFEDWIRNKALQRAEANTTFALRDRKTSDIYLQENKAKLDLRNALIQTEKEKVLDASLREGLVSIDASGNITGYTPGTIPQKSPSGGRSVKVGNTNYDWETFNYYADMNNPSFYQALVQDKDFRFSKNNNNLIPSPRTNVDQNQDGSYIIKGMFSTIKTDDEGNPYPIEEYMEINATPEEIKTAYLGSNIEMLKKIAPPGGVVSTVPDSTGKSKEFITPNGNIRNSNGDVVIQKGTKIPQYSDPQAAANDSTLAIGSWFYDKSTNVYRTITK